MMSEVEDFDLYKPGPSNSDIGSQQTNGYDSQPAPRETQELEVNSQGDSRSVSGLLSSYHGVAYQVQWNMVVALEAKQRLDDSRNSGFTFKTKDFKTEDPDAGKFDDLVWRYEIGGQNESVGGKRYEYNFLQAKHKLNKDEVISINELLKSKQKKEPMKRRRGEDKRPFALEKYFSSYKDKIKKGKKYEDGNVSNLIIATNINLDDDLKNNLFSEVECGSIPILDLIKTETGKKPEIWEIKTKRVGSHYEKINEQLQSTYDSMKLVNELVENVLKGEPITEESVLSYYLFDLMQNKIIDESGKCGSQFLENNDELSTKAKNFRNLLRESFKNKQVIVDEGLTIPNPQDLAELVANKIDKARKAEGVSKKFKVKIMRSKTQKELVDKNIDKLANFVLVEGEDNNIRFSNIFWTEEEDKLPGNVGEFRLELMKKLEGLGIIRSNDPMSDIAENLKKYTFNITGKSQEDKKDFKTCKEILLDEKTFWKSFQIDIDLSKLKLIKLAKDKDELLRRNIVGNDKKFCDEFIKGNVNLPSEDQEFRRFLLKQGFENKRKCLKCDFTVFEPVKFAGELVSLINTAGFNSEVRITRNKPIIRENIGKLANYVFVVNDENEIRFSHIFWEEEDNELPGNLKEFRNQLICNLLKSSIVSECDTGAQIACKLHKYSFKITNFSTCIESFVNEKTFWKSMAKGDIFRNIDGILPFNKELPKQSLGGMQNDINEFFSKLRFVISYSQNDLDKFIKKKCVDFIGFENDYVAFEFQVKVGNALNLASEDFISDSKQVERFFEESTKQLNALTLMGLTLETKAKMEQYGIEFRPELVADLLKCQLEDGSVSFLSSNKQIFNIISDQKDLTYIKLIQALDAIDEYKNCGNYASVNLNSIVLLQSRVMKAFNSNVIKLLLIKYEHVEENIDGLFSELSEALKSKRSKKVIFVTQDKDDLSTKFKSFFQDKYVERKDKQIGFVDLTDESQDELAKKSTLIFQGEEMTLMQLLEINKKLKELISGEELFDLIEDNKIVIGRSLPSIRDLNSPAYFKVMEVINEQNLKDVKNDIFVISGIDRESLARRFKVEVHKIIVASREMVFFEENFFQFVVLCGKNDDRSVDIFDDVCRQYEKNRSQRTEELDKRLIHFIEFQNDEFIWNRYYNPMFYIDRYFNKIQLDEKKLISDYLRRDNDEGSKQIFLAGAIQKDDFVKQHEIDEEMVASTLDELNTGNPIFIFSTNAAEKEAQKIFRSLDPNYIVHWIEKNGGKFFWKGSNGGMKVISKLRKKVLDQDINCRINERQFADVIKTERFVVIADVPGMGKSTAILSLFETYKNINPLDWVIIVNLRECEESIDNNLRDWNDSANSGKDCNFGSIVNFLSEIDPEGVQHPLAKKLLRRKLRSNFDGGILLLLDGFDEIRGNRELKSARQDKVIKLLKFLQGSTNGKVLITTRPYKQEKRKLEGALLVLSYNFSPITNDQSQNFLERLWQNSSKLLNNQKVADFRTQAKALRVKFQTGLKKKLSEFIGVPLQLQMLAEAYLKNIKGPQKNEGDGTVVEESLGDLNFSSFFADFIRRKYEIYFMEKNRFGKTVTDDDKRRLKESYEADHKYLAFKYYFVDEYESPGNFNELLGLFFPKRKFINTYELKDLKRIGIVYIKGHGKIDFVHRTFAEHFVSDLILDGIFEKTLDQHYSQKSKKAIWEFLLNRVCLEDDFNLIRNFISGKLSSHYLFKDFDTALPKYKDVLCDSLEVISNKKSQTQLHIASKEGLLEIVEFLLKNVPGNRFCSGDKLGNTPLHYALKGCHLGIIEAILNHAIENEHEDVINAQNFKGCAPLHIAAQNGPLEVVECLVDKGHANVNVKERPICFNFLGERNIHQVFQVHPYPGYMQFIEGDKDDYKGVDWEKVERALSVYESRYCSYSEHSPMHKTIISNVLKNKNDKLDIVQYLSEKGGDLNAKDGEGCSVLHHACSAALDKLVETLVGKFSAGVTSSQPGQINDYVNAKNIKGVTAIFLAAKKMRWKIFKNLMSLVECVDNSADEFGITTLHYLAFGLRKNCLNIMRDFLNKSQNYDVNIKTDKSETPLHWAAKKNNVKAVEVLLDITGVDIDVKNCEGQTALDLASLANFKAITVLLKKAQLERKRRDANGM